MTQGTKQIRMLFIVVDGVGYFYESESEVKYTVEILNMNITLNLN